MNDLTTKYIYVAAPYTIPDPDANTEKAIDAANTLLEYGYVPFCPHLTHMWHQRHPHRYEAWMAYDFAWLSRCDALVRLPGESPGADREVIYAQSRNIPVYLGLEAFLGRYAGAFEHKGR